MDFGFISVFAATRLFYVTNQGIN